MNKRLYEAMTKGSKGRRRRGMVKDNSAVGGGVKRGLLGWGGV